MEITAPAEAGAPAQFRQGLWPTTPIRSTRRRPRRASYLRIWRSSDPIHRAEALRVPFLLGDPEEVYQLVATAILNPVVDYLRVVSWETTGLRVLFSDWTDPAPGWEDWKPQPAPPNLRGYRYSGGTDDLALSTENGVTVGSTVDELVEAYGNSVRFLHDECVFNVAGFVVVDTGEDDCEAVDAAIRTLQVALTEAGIEFAPTMSIQLDRHNQSPG